MFLTAILWRIYIIRENKRRDRLVESMGMSKEAAEAEGRANGVKGMTDRQVRRLDPWSRRAYGSSEHSLSLPLLNGCRQQLLEAIVPINSRSAMMSLKAMYEMHADS